MVSSPMPEKEGPPFPSPTKFDPRRPPAHLSVSLRHDANANPTEGLVNGGGNDLGAPDVSFNYKSARMSSRASNVSGESQNANVNKWFDRSNKNPNNVYLDDNDSPYFLPNHSSNDSGNENQEAAPRPTEGTQPHFTSAPRTLQARSSTDEYRSVIDDLTIENKKLKEKLRRYQKLEGGLSQKDKLFAIKIHSLSARKREEFVDTLRDFVSNLDASPKHSPAPSGPLYQRASMTTAETSSRKVKSSSNKSLSRPEDSAYASLSASGLTSASTLNRMSSEKKQTPPLRASQDQNVRSYLEDIPEGIAPRHLPPMTERQKKKLVVQRLEQLFTGKVGLIGGNDQPLQQQEVSKSAARTDEEAQTGIILAEGAREAHIQPFMDEGVILPKVSSDTSNDMQDLSDESSIEQLSLEQRPTRPLDLDPDRAQIPADNVEYIRHLGISTPQLINEDSVDAAPDAHGWVYLNLLINMAQLHMVNVTPDFVRAAVSEVSEKFQLSRDGKQVRWRGGSRGTRFSSDSGTNSEQNRSPNDSDSLDEGARKRRKIDFGKSTATSAQTAAPSMPSNSSSHPFQYKPMFYHQSSPSDNLASTDESDSLPDYQDKALGGMFHGANLYRDRSSSGSRRARQSDDGVIVFYSGVNFYTDLSGDQNSLQIPLHDTGVGGDGYSDHTHDALGCPPRNAAPSFSRTASGFSMPWQPFKEDLKGAAPLGIEDAPTTPQPLAGDSEPFFVDEIPPGPAFSAPLLELNACGLGGTRAADHFMMQIETRRTRKDKQSVRISKSIIHTIPGSSLESFLHHSPEAVEDSIASHLAALVTISSPSPQPTPVVFEDFPVKIQVTSILHKDLPPSELPAGVGYYDPSENSEDESDSSSGESYRGISHLRDAKIDLQRPAISGDDKVSGSPPSGDAVLEDLQNGFRTDMDSDIEDNVVDNDSDESIDMLAHARKADPDFIRAKEQQFEMEIDSPEMEAVSAAVKSSVATVDEESYYTNATVDQDVAMV